MSLSASAAGDSVVGVFDRADLSAALVATHRAGFGPHARVLDGARGDLVGQLRRAGLRVPLAPATDPGTVLVVVTAPGRAAAVAQILTEAGARAVHGASRGTTPAADSVPVPAVDAFIDGEAGAAS